MEEIGFLEELVELQCERFQHYLHERNIYLEDCIHDAANQQPITQELIGSLRRLGAQVQETNL